MGEEITCGSFSVEEQYDFLCGEAEHFCIGKMLHLHA